jgi:hypothetical protein
MIIGVLCILILAIFWMTSLIGYIFILLIFVCSVIIWLSMIMNIRELLSLMILLVYVGAISVLFIYVSAVSPNTPINTPGAYIVYGTIIVCGVLFVHILDVSHYISSVTFSTTTSDEIFTGVGVLSTLVVAYILIVVLAGVTFISPSASTFRSFS